MKKTGFFSWYFGRGIKSFFEIWRNYFDFFWFFFGVRELFSTLFFPWKKDVSLKTWIGFHPTKSLELFLSNFFSRFIGSLVRIFFILLALLTEFLWIASGILFLILWVGFPLWLSLSFYLFIFFGDSWLLLSLFLFFFAILVLIFRRNSKRKLPSEMSSEEIERQKWFERLAHRLGKASAQDIETILQKKEVLEKILAEKNLPSEDFEKILSWEISMREKRELQKIFWSRENLFSRLPMGIYWKYGFTVNLNRYSAEITAFDPSEYSGYEKSANPEKLDMLKLVLEKNRSNSALLVGPIGCGKKSLIHSLARMIRKNQMNSPALREKRVMLLDLNSALSSARSKKLDLMEYVHRIFTEAAFAGNIILVLENLENYLGKNNDTFSFDVSPVIEEYLDVPSFQIIATSTSQEYHALIEKKFNIMKNLEVIEVEEASEENSMDMLLQKFEKLEKNRVIFTLDGLKAIVRRSQQIAETSSLPQRAIDLAGEILLFWKDSDKNFVDEEITDRYVSQKTGIPMGEAEEDEKNTLLNLENLLHQRVVGQNQAISQIAQAMRKARSGIGNSQKPIGSFLFLGPTGVGKTEVAKALAESYFGDENRMIRFDMSEFQNPESLEWLIGSTRDGKPGRMATQAKDNPFSLILLDEIEKAYPEILDLFLQVLDEGHLTDAFGEKISFKNTIIIATSNAGSNLLKNIFSQKDKTPAAPEETKKELLNDITEKGIFRVEFLNRFDDVVFFLPLNPEELRQVASLMLEKLGKRVSQEKNIEIFFEEKIVDQIIQEGYDPIFGARSLNRYIGNKIESLLAEKIISGGIKNGQSLNLLLEDLKKNF